MAPENVFNPIWFGSFEQRKTLVHFKAGLVNYSPRAKFGLPPVSVWPTKLGMVFMFFNGWGKKHQKKKKVS